MSLFRKFLVNRRGFLKLLPAMLAGATTTRLAALENKAPRASCMLKPTKDSDFTADPILTIGDQIGSYRPPGILDGMGAWDWNQTTLRLFVNHELNSHEGYPYVLANQTELRGARVSWIDIDKQTHSVKAAGNAIASIYDRRGEPVTEAQQVSEFWGTGWFTNFRSSKDPERGLNNLCSAQACRAGEYGFIDDLLFTHEEVSALDNHPHGGSVWALDVRNNALWAVPELGRGSWENVTPVNTPDQEKPDGHIALLMGDDFDRGGAPLYLWLGNKIPGGNLLERNGLAAGQLYAWVADNGDRSPQDWHGTGNERAGKFVPLKTHATSKAGTAGHDRDGWCDDVRLRQQAANAGAFMMSRPEDLHTNPANGLQVALCSTGQGDTFPADDWGTVYLIEMHFKQSGNDLAPGATLKILHDADDFGDHGIRSADNIVWAHDGQLYIHEDKANKVHEFGGETGRDASTWRLNPNNIDDYELLAVIDRAVVLPPDSSDYKKGIMGAWECCGLIDVTELLGKPADELWFITAVQAHSISDGAIGGAEDLVEGGQLVVLHGPAH